MRKKMNAADKFYIEKKCLTMSAEEIEINIDLAYNSFYDHYVWAKKDMKSRQEAESKGVAVLTSADAAKADDIAEKRMGRQRPDNNFIWKP